ncbi:EspA/EspE family type VII secretion system effector [Mycobacterium kansasii]
MSRAFIIDPTIGFIDGMYVLLGIGVPDDGGIINSALSFFAKALDDLGSAFPGDSWQGSAAENYAGKNKDQLNFFQQLAELDRELQRLIADQANAVEKTRDVLAGVRKGLEFVRPVAVDLTYIPLVGWAMSASFQAPICAAGMAVVGGALAYLTVETLIHTAQLLGLLAKLASLLASVVVDIVSDVVDIIDDILVDVWDFITNPIGFLENLLGDLAQWAYALLSKWGSTLESFFMGVPGLAGMSGGLSQLTGFFSSPTASGSAGLASLDSLAGAGLPGLPGVGAGLGGLPNGLGGLTNVAQLRSAADRQDVRPHDDASAKPLSEQLGAQQQSPAAQGPQGLGGMHPAAGSAKGAPGKKYAEGAAAGTDGEERAPVEAGVGGGQLVSARRVV